jgi:hypothetical protein
MKIYLQFSRNCALQLCFPFNFPGSRAAELSDELQASERVSRRIPLPSMGVSYQSLSPYRSCENKVRLLDHLNSVCQKFKPM